MPFIRRRSGPAWKDVASSCHSGPAPSNGCLHVTTGGKPNSTTATRRMVRRSRRAIRTGSTISWPGFWLVRSQLPVDVKAAQSLAVRAAAVHVPRGRRRGQAGLEDMAGPVGQYQRRGQLYKHVTTGGENHRQWARGEPPRRRLATLTGSTIFVRLGLLAGVGKGRWRRSANRSRAAEYQLGVLSMLRRHPLQAE